MGAYGKRFAVALVALLALSACRVKMDVATTVEEDGSGKLVVTVLMSETAREALQEKELKSDDPRELAELRERGEDVFERGSMPLDLLEDDVPEGWRGERISEDDLEGMRLRGEFASLDEIPTLLGSLSEFGAEMASRFGRTTDDVGPAALAKGFSITRDGSLFHLEGEPDAEAYEGAAGGANNLDAELTLTVDLPGGIREHDADEKADDALVWRIPPGESRTISATSDLDYDPVEIPWTSIGIGGATLGLFGLLAWRARWSRRDDRGSEPPEAGAPEDVPAPV